MLIKIIFALAVVLLAVLAYVATRPNAFRIERAVSISASPEKIFALIDDFHQWEAWSPWERAYPQIQRSYSGASSGVGAVYEWRGNKDIGQGRMEIVESAPATRLLLKLDFITPFEAHNQVEFTLAAQGASTTLTQAMFGPSPFVAKLMSLFFNMEKMVGPKYEEGLASIKALAEK